MKKTLLLLMISGIMTALLTTLSVAVSEDPLSSAGFMSFKVEKNAPDFMLKDLENNLVSLKAFQGQIVLLSFWTTWCPSCRKEMPSLTKLYNEFKNRNFVVIGINVGERRQHVKTYIEKKKINIPVLLDIDGKVEKEYGVRAHPTHFLIDKKGKIMGKALGSKNWMNSKNCDLIRSLLHEGGF